MEAHPEILPGRRAWILRVRTYNLHVYLFCAFVAAAFAELPSTHVTCPVLNAILIQAVSQLMAVAATYEHGNMY